MLNTIVAGCRFVTALTILFLGSVLVVLSGPIPIEREGSRLSAWILTLTCRLFLRIINVTVAPFDRAKVRQHRGFIFANHQSYLETIVVFSVRPCLLYTSPSPRD